MSRNDRVAGWLARSTITVAETVFEQQLSEHIAASTLTSESTSDNVQSQAG